MISNEVTTLDFVIGKTEELIESQTSKDAK